MAGVEQIRWYRGKIVSGWFFGRVKDARTKTHLASDILLIGIRI